MSNMTSKKIKTIVFHVLVSIGGLIMVYPLLWMVLSSFKPTELVLPTSRQLIPTVWTLDNYVNGWKGFMGYTFGTFFGNSFLIAFTATFGTLISSAFVAYALQRLHFKGKKILFTLVLSTMMLAPPGTETMQSIRDLPPPTIASIMFRRPPIRRICSFSAGSS